MSHDYSARRLTGHRRFRDVSHFKLTDLLKSLRRQRLRRGVSQRSPLTCSQSFPPPLANHTSPVQPPSPNLVTSSVRHRSDAVSILSTTEEDCSAGTSTSSTSLEDDLPDVKWPRQTSSRPTFPTSPSMFQLRSSSTKDYLVDRLERHLSQLSLGDASPDHVTVRQSSSIHDIQMDVVSPPRTTETSSRHVHSSKDARQPTSSPHDSNVVPMILITSVDAKHAKPLPPSSQRPSRTPFFQSNAINHHTNSRSTKSKPQTSSDDPFVTQPHGFTHPPDYNLTFRLPAFPTAYPTPSKYAPETPTPMCCDHFGDCRGDLWEVLHPPLVAGKFTLPPFELPPLSTGIFDDASMPLSY